MRLLQPLRKTIRNFGKTAIFVLVTILVQGWQVSGVIAIAIINNRPWECLFIFTGFTIGRFFFGKSYHAKTLVACTSITWIVFYFLTSAVPSFKVSVTIPCIFGVCLAYALHKISEIIEGMRKE